MDVERGCQDEAGMLEELDVSLALVVRMDADWPDAENEDSFRTSSAFENIAWSTEYEPK